MKLRTHTTNPNPTKNNHSEFHLEARSLILQEIEKSMEAAGVLDFTNLEGLQIDQESYRKYAADLKERVEKEFPDNDEIDFDAATLVDALGRNHHIFTPMVLASIDDIYYNSTEGNPKNRWEQLALEVDGFKPRATHEGRNHIEIWETKLSLKGGRLANSKKFRPCSFSRHRGNMHGFKNMLVPLHRLPSRFQSSLNRSFMQQPMNKSVMLYSQDLMATISMAMKI